MTTTHWLNRCHFGDCLETLRQMPDGLVQTCVTSPPYFGLRDMLSASGIEPREPEEVATADEAPTVAPATVE